MKLRNKLIAVITPAAVIATTAPITLVSCTDKNSISYTGDKNITVTGSTVELTFTLKSNLASGQSIKTTTKKADTHGIVVLPSTTQTSGKNVKVTFSVSGTSGTANLSLDFICVDASFKEVFKTTIEGFVFTK